MKYYIKLLFAILIPIFIACSDSTTKKNLILAESLMTEQPDSALSILRNINSTSLKGYNQALYAVLYSHAQYRNYIIEMNDSLISIAVNYFREHNDKNHLMTALYCQGRIRVYNGNYSGGMISSIECEEIALQLKDNYYLGRAYELMGEIFNETYDDEKAIDKLHKSAEHYNKSGRNDNYRYVMIDLAASYANHGEYNRCIELSDSIMDNYINDKSLINYGKYRQLISLYKLQQYDRLMDNINFLFKNSDKQSIPNCYIYLIRLAISQKKLDLAKFYLSELKSLEDNYDQLTLKQMEYEYAIGCNNYNDALEIILDLQTKKDSIFYSIIENNVPSAISEYYKYRSLKSESDIENHKIKILLLIVISIFILCSVIYYLHEKVKHKEYKLKQQIHELKDSISTLNIKNSSITKNKQYSERLQKSIARLIKEKFEIVNNICDELFAYNDDEPKQKQKIIARKAQQIIEDMKGHKFRSELEHNLNQDLNGIITKLREEMPQLSKDDINFLIYTFAGFSTKSICIFTNLKRPSVYSKKKRLKEYIQM